MLQPDFLQSANSIFEPNAFLKYRNTRRSSTDSSNWLRILQIHRLFGHDNKLQKSTATELTLQGHKLTTSIKAIIKEIYENEVKLLQLREDTFQWNFNINNIFFNTINI